MEIQKFNNLLSQMGVIGHKVANNSIEIDTVYIMGSIEFDAFYYNVFFRTENKLFRVNKLECNIKNYQINYDNIFALFDEGIKVLKEIKELLEKENQQVPTLIKLYFYPKQLKLNTTYEYLIQYSEDDELMPDDLLERWFEEESQIN